MVLTVLLDIIMPEGQTNKYIKGIFSVIVTIVIITPITGFLKGGINLDGFFDFSSGYDIDNNYIYSVYAEAERREEADIKDYLMANDIEIVMADMVFDAADKKKLNYINIFLAQSVIDGDSAHININDKIKELLSQRYGLKREDIRILIW
jgi:hypothetical protein